MNSAENAANAMRRGGAKGMKVALKNTLDTSNAQAPHEEGDLTRDGKTVVDMENLRGAVSYGYSADVRRYVVNQHENMSYHHDAGRNAKFLERAFAETRDQNLEIIAQSIKKELGNG